MDAVIEEAVGRVIETMRRNVGDRITIDDMARTARFSKFHFSRLFQRATGVSPGRFLSALRLQEAKQLLVSTTLNVGDISHRVGYTSPGTFSTRFTSSVGIAPTTYRRLGGVVSRIAVNPAAGHTATIHGWVTGAATTPAGRIFIGLFPDCLAEGRPIDYAILAHPGPYALRRVPRGIWHLHAHLIPAVVPDETSLYIGRSGPIMIRTDTEPHTTNIALRPTHAFDPPILLPWMAPG